MTVSAGINADESHASSRSNPFASGSFWGAAFLGTCLALLSTGFSFPTNNNVFHLPIIERLYDLPGFAGDAFIQSMRYYSSGFWIILEGSADWAEPSVLFAVLMALSYLLTFVGFLACADYFGLRRLKPRLLFATLVALSPFMRGVSYAGGGGLFIGFFTHSEIANGLFLLAAWGLLTRRLTFALSLVGPTTFINAFFGVWLASVLCFVLGVNLVTKRMAWRELIKPIAVSFVVALAFSLPVIMNIVSNPDFGRPITFNYIEYLEQYWPYHFLYYTISADDYIKFVLLILLAASCLMYISDENRQMPLILFACVLLYILGMVAPHLTQSRWVLNLHLLRSSTLVHLLGTLLLAVVLVRWWLGADKIRMVLAAALACASTLVFVFPSENTKVLFLIAGSVGLSFLLSRLPRRPDLEAFIGRWKALVGAVAVVTIGTAALVSAYSNYEHNRSIAPLSEQWGQVAEWIRTTTPADAVFLPFGGAPVEFEASTHRQVWVDQGRGAAVMWSPSYYDIWRPRMLELRAMDSFDERLSYARDRGIAYLIESPGTGCGSYAVFSTEDLCVARVE